MASNETSNYLLEWIKQISFLLSFIVPTYLVIRKIASDYHERQVKKDREAITEVVHEQIEIRLRQIKENYVEMQELLRQGKLK